MPDSKKKQTRHKNKDENDRKIKREKIISDFKMCGFQTSIGLALARKIESRFQV
jgi:hypothetical protein